MKGNWCFLKRKVGPLFNSGRILRKPEFLRKSSVRMLPPSANLRPKAKLPNPPQRRNGEARFPLLSSSVFCQDHNLWIFPDTRQRAIERISHRTTEHQLGVTRK